MRQPIATRNLYASQPSAQSVEFRKQLDLRKQIAPNLMEELVIQEAEAQIQQLPAKSAQFVKAVDGVVYTLNRLPAMYASTKRGRQLQCQEATGKLKQQIEAAVRQGIAAVYRDPLRSSEPWEDTETPAANKALEALRQELRYDRLNWENLPDVVRYRLAQVARGEMEWRGQGSFDWEKFPLHQKTAQV